MSHFLDIKERTLVLTGSPNSAFVHHLFANPNLEIHTLSGCIALPYPHKTMHVVLEKISTDDFSQIILLGSMQDNFLQKLPEENDKLYTESPEGFDAKKLAAGLASGTDSLLWMMAVKEHVGRQLQNLLTWPAIKLMTGSGNIRLRGFVVNEHRNVFVEVSSPHG